MKQKMEDKLRLIADCIEQGIDVQVEGTSCEWEVSQLAGGYRDVVQIYSKLNYRAKPDKPRTGIVQWADNKCREYAYESVELTPEVIQALKDAGIET